jgi:hypothetical protein
MKKYFSAVIVALFVVLCCTGMAIAKDVIINKEIKAISFKNDKNGNQYARIFVSQDRTLNGVSYKRDIAIMGFGEHVAKLKAYKKGQTIKLVCSEGEYKGNPSYTILDIAK